MTPTQSSASPAQDLLPLPARESTVGARPVRGLHCLVRGVDVVKKILQLAEDGRVLLDDDLCVVEQSTRLSDEVRKASCRVSHVEAYALAPC